MKHSTKKKGRSHAAPGERLRSVQAPLALASSGEVLVNASYVLGTDDHQEVLERLRASGARIFIGIVVPASLMPKVLRQVDDAAAEIAATTQLSGLVAELSASASGQSSAVPASGSRGRSQGQAPRPRDRRRGP